MLNLNTLYLCNCLEKIKEIDANSIQLVLSDIPYSTTEACFDNQIVDFKSLFNEMRRVLTKNGTFITTCCFPFAADLIVNNKDLFKYDMIWKKSKATNFANAKNKPMRKFENILVFSKGTTANGSSNKMIYNPQGLVKIDKKQKYIRNTSSFMGLRDNWKGNEYIQEFTNYPNNILEFNNEKNCIWQTQKPLDLYEFLVKTFSNKNDIILEPFCGSGTTLIACKNNNRKFIGFELDEKAYTMANKRLNPS